MTSELRDLQSRFLHSLVRQSGAISEHLNARSQARLSIYQSGYIARLRSNLEAVYPALVSHLGGEFFAALARGYIGRHPSAEFSLYDFGAGFADFLIESQNGHEGLGLPVDIARYERALSAVGRAAGWPDDVQGADVAREPVADLVAQVSLVEGPVALNPSFQRLELTHDVRALVSALRRSKDDTPALPGVEGEVVLAIWRSSRTTQTARLSAAEAAFLGALQDGSEQTERPEPSWMMRFYMLGLLKPSDC